MIILSIHFTMVVAMLIIFINKLSIYWDVNHCINVYQFQFPFVTDCLGSLSLPQQHEQCAKLLFATAVAKGYIFLCNISCCSTLLGIKWCNSFQNQMRWPKFWWLTSTSLSSATERNVLQQSGLEVTILTLAPATQAMFALCSCLVRNTT